MDMQLPAHLQGDRRQLGAQSVQGMGMAPVPYISIEGQKFTLVDAAGQTFAPPTYGPIFTQRDQQGNEVAVQGSPVGLYLDVVLVDVNEHISKTYYANPYSPNAQSFLPPDCWSDNGTAPSIGATRPQAERCDLCPHNVWGSKINALGNKVKACDDMMKLAFFVPSLGMKTIFLMRLKGSSFKNWRTYVEKLMRNTLGSRQVDPTDVVSRMYFTPDQIGILEFAWKDLIDAPTAALEDEVWKTHATDALVGRLDKPRVLALPAPGAPTPAFQPPAAVQAPPPMPPQGQPAYQAQPGFAPSQQPVGPPQGFGGQAPPFQAPATHSVPAAAAEPPKPQRRRRAAAPAQEATQVPQPPGFEGAQHEAAQLWNDANKIVAQRQPAPGPNAAPAAPRQPTPPSNFGIQQGMPLNAELDAALADALKPLPPA